MEKPPLIFVIPLTLLAGAFQIYFWGLWSAYCVAVTYKFTIRPAVTWDWLYFITGFFDASSLIAWLSYKEQQGESYQRQTEVRRGTMYYAAVAWIAYIVFAIWPSLITPVYGWATDLLNLTRYIKPTADQFDLAEKPGDRIVPYSINRDRVKELEGKIHTLAELIGAPPQEVRRQYFDAIENVSGMDVDRLQAIMWKVLQDGGMPEKNGQVALDRGGDRSIEKNGGVPGFLASVVIVDAYYADWA